jgi:tripartite-type tricarboxylate transporter receptor subunit TctC
MTTWWGVMAPAKTPNEIVARLSIEILRALDSADAKERLRTMGSETPSVRSPEAFTAFIESEKALYARLVKVSGAKPD